MNASHLFLLTDVSSLYTANPRLDVHATPIHEVHDITSLSVSHPFSDCLGP